MKIIVPQKRILYCPSLFFFALALIISGLLMGCIPHKPIVPKVTQEDTAFQLTGKFIWYDIVTLDIAGTATFYGELFGWSFENVADGEGQLQTISLDGVPIGNVVGVLVGAKEEFGAQWLGYMSVPDVDASVEMVGNNQGTLYYAAKELPDRGRVAVVRDPQGAMFALIRASAGDPPDSEVKHSKWIGSELWTVDINGALDFYSVVAGYEEQLVPLESGETYHLLKRDGQFRAGIAEIPWDDVKPNWIPYVAVENVEEVVSKAVALGASLIMEPDSAFPANEVAILADPSGAVFGIQQIDLNPSPQGN